DRRTQRLRLHRGRVQLNPGQLSQQTRRAGLRARPSFVSCRFQLYVGWVSSRGEMVKRIGTDWGLNLRMVLTMFLLACVYLAFVGALYYFGVNAGFIIVIALVLPVAQY